MATIDIDPNTSNTSNTSNTKNSNTDNWLEQPVTRKHVLVGVGTIGVVLAVKSLFNRRAAKKAAAVAAQAPVQAPFSNMGASLPN